MISLLLAFMLVCVVSSSPFFPMGPYGHPMAGPMLPMHHPQFGPHPFAGPPMPFMRQQMQMPPLRPQLPFREPRRPRIIVAPKGWRKALAARRRQAQMMDPRGSFSGQFNDAYRQFDRPDFRVDRGDFRRANMQGFPRVDRRDFRRVGRTDFRQGYADQRDVRRDYQNFRRADEMSAMRDRARQEAMQRRAFAARASQRAGFSGRGNPSMGRMRVMDTSFDRSRSVGDIRSRLNNREIPSLEEARSGMNGARRLVNSMSTNNIGSVGKFAVRGGSSSPVQLSLPRLTIGRDSGVRVTGPRLNLNNRRDVIDLSNVGGRDALKTTANRQGTRSIAEPIIDLSNVDIHFPSNAGMHAALSNGISAAMRAEMVSDLMGKMENVVAGVQGDMNIPERGNFNVPNTEAGSGRAHSGREVEPAENERTNTDVRSDASRTAVRAPAAVVSGGTGDTNQNAEGRGQGIDVITAPGGAVIGTKATGTDFTDALLRDPTMSGLGPIQVVTLNSEESFRNLEQALMGQSANQDLLNSVLGQGGDFIDSVFGQRSDLLNAVFERNTGVTSAQGGDNFQVVILDSDQMDLLTRQQASAGGGSQIPNRADVPYISQAGSVLGPGTDAENPQRNRNHIADGHGAVGRVGKPVSSIVMGATNDAIGLFSVPRGASFPDVPKSVSSIPASIGQAMRKAPGHSVGHT